MAKPPGGTRNYNPNSKAWLNRYSEYNELLSTGNCDTNRSFFDTSGGFYVTHKEHDKIAHPDIDKSDIAINLLAAKGYRIYLDAEKTTISDSGKKKDGRIEKLAMDIKTINSDGKNTIKRNIEEAAKQKAKAVILYQNTPKMDKKYVLEQLYGEDGFIMKSPKRAVLQIDWVIVIGSNGHVHRHNLIKERWKRSL